MKIKLYYFIAFFAFFLTSQDAFSQVDRRIGREQYKRKRAPREKKDFVAESVKYLTAKLTLDAFQEAAVREIIESERANIDALNNMDVTSAEKNDRAIIISDRIYKKVIPLLSKEQAEIYTKMEEAKNQL